MENCVLVMRVDFTFQIKSESLNIRSFTWTNKVVHDHACGKFHDSCNLVPSGHQLQRLFVFTKYNLCRDIALYNGTSTEHTYSC